MLAIAINYLNGRVTASTYNSGGAMVEWPPHPDRVFMALVAAWGETGQDDAGEQALRWLEGQTAPSLAAGECQARQSVRHYVPVNDDLPRAQLGRLLPESRSRQGRQFATAALDNPVAHLIWPDANPSEHLPALQNLAAGVTNVGHSSSLVQAYLDDAPPPANWQPVDGPGGYLMRVPYAGRFDDLVDAYRKRQQDPQGHRPEARRWIGYRKTAAAPDAAYPQTVFSDNLIIFETSGSGLDLRAAGQLTAALRNLIMAQCPEPIPEWVSGHTPDGGRSAQPHIALIPLPFVGSNHADGRVLGLAIAVPRAVPPQEAGQVLHELIGYDDSGALKSHIILKGRWNAATLRQPEPGDHRPARYNLQVEAWTRPSTHWHTVTPVTLDRYYKGPDKARLERENVAEQCRRIGLPTPAAVVLGPVSMLEGVPPAREFARLRRRSDSGGKGEWQHTHASIVFAAPVRGPVIIGSGRYRGYGLCRPVS